MTDRVTVYPGKLGGVISAIPSKSHVHRLLICAALSMGETFINCASVNDDILATARCLTALGARIEQSGAGYRVSRGTVAAVAEPDCGESGSTFRFLLPIASALGVQAKFHLSGRLPQRPMGALYGAMELHGAHITGAGSSVIGIDGRMSGGTFVLPGNISSQFISALVFALPLTREGGKITISSPLESRGYVEMTLNAVKSFGINAEWRGDSIIIPGGQEYVSPGNAKAEGDWSAASCILCAASACGGSVEIKGLSAESSQGDKEIAEIIRDFKARHANIDISNIPDLAPAIALLGAACSGTTRLTGAGRLRLKESDRAGSITRTLTALGAKAECQGDEIIICGGAPLHGCTIDPEGDHRIAMLAACTAAIVDSPITVNDASVVNKSYPGFYDDIGKLGLRAERCTTEE